MVKKYRAKLKVFDLEDYKTIAIQIAKNNPALSLMDEVTIYEQVTSELIKRHELEYIKFTNYIVDLGGVISIDLMTNIFGNQVTFKVSEDKIIQIKNHPFIEDIDLIQ